uniref:Cadherin EGF LAG seven-pass G-type receptor 1 n=1 Tax=Sarcophilus harrisii TaxID=9305 RepID=G3VTD1_SARHA
MPLPSLLLLRGSALLLLLLLPEASGGPPAHPPAAAPRGPWLRDLALGPAWRYALDWERTAPGLRPLLKLSPDGGLRLGGSGRRVWPRGCELPLHVDIASRRSPTRLTVALAVAGPGRGCGSPGSAAGAPARIPDLAARTVLGGGPGPASPSSPAECFPAPEGGGRGPAEELRAALEALTSFPDCRCVASFSPGEGGKDGSGRGCGSPPAFPLRPICLEPGAAARLLLLCAPRPGPGPGPWRRLLRGRGPELLLELTLEAAGPLPAGARRARRGAAGGTSPQFQLPSYQVSVPENEPAGTPVIELRAQDPDEGEAGRLTYQMEALFDERSNGYFHIEPDTGAVTTSRPLDRETKDTHVLKVTAVDHGSPQRSGATYLTVTVSDTNDHSPVFEQVEYRETVRENLEVGYEVLTIRATDGDAPSNANMRYRLLEGADGAFEIDPRSGVVRTRSVVDREEVAEYQLLVEANDQGRNPGPRSATATVRILVEDENDNYPQFSEKRYVVRVPEDVAVNTPILWVQATDRDQGQNAALHYSIVSGNLKGQFYLHSLSGGLDVINPLDFEAIREYTLRIKAQDGGRPPLINSSGLVNVQVLDVNDNAPIFVSSPFQAAVLENVPLGHSVLHIQAVDADSGENARLHYRLVDVTTGAGADADASARTDFPFQIHNSSGWITVCAELDREEVEHYRFGVEAMDHGSPVMSSSASVAITVLDVNDNDPVFTQPVYELRLNEDATVGSSVLTLQARDRDANSVITYQLTSGNTRNRFALSSQSGGGLITLALPLDYKQERQYVLGVTASDGTRSHTAQVFINVTDANTHRPVFQSSHYTVSVREDQPVGTSIATISATDEDTGENARITYVLEDPVPQFRIHPDTGTIVTLMELDYEDQAAYTLAITARDNGIPQKSDTTSLEILILDANDNAPHFLRDFYQGSVFEDAPPSTSVLQVSATDRDSGPNGRLLYTFQGGEDGDGDFYIEPTSGVIRTQRRLDRENVAVYNLRALAVDRGSPAPLSASVEIQVTVLDINDNPPVFDQDELELFVEENSPVGSVVARIRATSAPLVSRATVYVRLVDQNDNPPVLPDFQVLFNNYVTNKSNSFPTGVIGRIPAHDPDLSDSLNYTFLQGNELNLLLLNSDTGELQLSRDLDNNRPLEALMEVSVSDGIHSVTALCTLRVTIITDDMLTNSITVRLENMSQEKFLSPLLSLFVEGVAAVLSTTTDGIFVFNVQNDTDVSSNILNVTFSALLPGGVRNRFFPSEDLQEQIYLNRTLLRMISTQRVLPFDDNICLREPCENYMKCVSVLKFDSSAPFISSTTVLFRPIHPISGLRCRCPPGFTGDYCETEIDLCYSNPCGGNGLCRSREGGYTCDCHPDYTGEFCEVNARSGRCAPGVCKNGGRCVNLLVGGFKCECPPGEYEKPYCGVSTRSFPAQSFVTFKGLRQRFHFTLSLTFATRERNALLLYNGRFNEKHDFLALEIIEEQIQLTFSAGETRTTVAPLVRGGVSDGQWHSVRVQYYNKPHIGRLGIPHGPSGEKVAVVAVDECDTAVAVRFSGLLANYSCAAQGTQTGSKKSLDLTGPLLLGGVPNLPEDFPVHNRQFIGCMRNLSIDNQAIDMESFIANNGTRAGCAAQENHCQRIWCQNGGTCVNKWNTYICDCPLRYGGKNCEQAMPHPQRFSGESLVFWGDLDITISVPWYLGLMFRTRKGSGTLLEASAGPSSKISLQILNSHVDFAVFHGPSEVASMRLGRSRVSDGRWHHLLIELRSAKDGKDIKYLAVMTLDYGLDQNTVQIGNQLPGLKMRSLLVGGLSEDQVTVRQGFSGCMQGVRMGETSTNIVTLNMKEALKVRVKDGCALDNPCASSPCPEHSHCTDDWDSYSCTCDPGYFGRDCVDVCNLNPCEHVSTCVRKPSSAQGYACECGQSYYGQYCENKIHLPCPKGWWGNPVCGPCHCEVSKGFDPDCNKTNGECQCKENYYKPQHQEACYPCDCFPYGSHTRTCDMETGQCACKSGVIGRQCNRCDNPFAEVTTQGCEVIYSGCPRAFEAGIWWPQTKFGQPAAVPCPKGSVGNAIRHCSSEKGWLPPELFNCTTSSFLGLRTMNEKLRRNETRMDGDKSIRLMHVLENVTRSAGVLYGNDVRTAYHTMLHVLQYESRQQGFDLAATRDAEFHEVRDGGAEKWGLGGLGDPGGQRSGVIAFNGPRRASAPPNKWRSPHQCFVVPSQPPSPGSEKAAPAPRFSSPRGTESGPSPRVLAGPQRESRGGVSPVPLAGTEPLPGPHQGSSHLGRGGRRAGSGLPNRSRVGAPGRRVEGRGGRAGVGGLPRRVLGVLGEGRSGAPGGPGARGGGGPKPGWGREGGNALKVFPCGLGPLLPPSPTSPGCHCPPPTGLPLPPLTGLPLSPQFTCTVIAILLHYFYLSTFAWLFVEGLHVYRMLTEVRNIDSGHMRFYYVLGWGIPAVVTGQRHGALPPTWGLAAGLLPASRVSRTRGPNQAFLLGFPPPKALMGEKEEFPTRECRWVVWFFEGAQGNPKSPQFGGRGRAGVLLSGEGRGPWGGSLGVGRECNDSDSDSELSLEEHSSSYASSSDSEEDGVDEENKWAPGSCKTNDRGPIHSTPKGTGQGGKARGGSGGI